MTACALRHTVVPSLIVLLGLSATLAVAAPQTKPAPARTPTTTKPSETEFVAAQRRAAERGDPDAQYTLGLMYDVGKGVPQDDAQAAAWYRKAADQGMAQAQSNRGRQYLLGQGVPQDDTEAANWVRKAAEQGIAGAQQSLGSLLAAGRGVPQDYAQAAAWFRKAAEQGNAAAQGKLGAAYGLGRGVPQDYVEAHKWFNLASARGLGKDQETDAHLRDEIAKQMTPQQLAEAQKRASDWLAAFEKRQK